jgi:uncharacterized damage-inducible protein DinB
MTDLAAATLNAIKVRITRVLPMQVHTAVEKLTDEQLWWRPNGKSNSIANLILHIAGSLDHYLNRAIGGFAYDRDRDAEFAARDTMSKANLLARLDEMVGRAVTTFDRLTPDRLSGPSTDPDRNNFLIEDLISINTHLADHVGQIVWIAKMLNEGSLDEAWMRAHKRGGAWK